MKADRETLSVSGPGDRSGMPPVPRIPGDTKMVVGYQYRPGKPGLADRLKAAWKALRGKA